MCGRTCLTLEPDEIKCACKYTVTNSEDGKEKTPDWRSEFNCGRKYQPSHNICPTDITPVVVSADHFENEDKSQQRTVVPMMWGMIPFWHKGDYRKHGLTTNNCRLEHMLESKLYRGPFRKGQRCVVICEGFYEWQTTKSAKPSERNVYFLHIPQTEGVKIYDKSTWAPDNMKLLKMAGLFDIWEDENGDKMYSYSVITYESSNLLTWLHHRMPAILETEQQVSDWLDFKHVPDDKALAALKPVNKLSWYQVSNLVNNSRNKSDKCNKPITEAQSTSKWQPKSKIMQSWLIIRKRKEEKIKQELVDSDEENEMPKRVRYSRQKKNGSETTETETDYEVLADKEAVKKEVQEAEYSGKEKKAEEEAENK